MLHGLHKLPKRTNAACYAHVDMLELNMSFGPPVGSFENEYSEY